jgi:membrane fusion protein, copper/silver efflux system
MNRTVKTVIAVTLLLAAMVSGYLYGRRPADSSSAEGRQSQKSEYTCPMHPFIIKDSPGACPICSMDLVRKVEGLDLNQDLKGKQHVALSPSQQVMANLATATVTARVMSKTIECTGVVAYNQEKLGKLSAWVPGRIDQLNARSVGSLVSKTVPALELFSSDLYNAQVQYLLAYKTIKILNNTATVPFPVNTQMALGESHERLRQLGFRDEQFIQLQNSNKPAVRVPVYSPFPGVVTEISVREGQYVNVGETLMTVADLSRLWVELEVFENDLALVRTGQDVAIRSRAYPELSITGKVRLIYPFMDPKSRTARVRVEIPNPGLKLKPDMFVNGSIKAKLTETVVVPLSAVMDTGRRQLVWIESSSGIFQPRDVKTGLRSGGDVQILSGLKAGEKIAVSGAYLIDSEAQLSRMGGEAAQPPAAPDKPGEKKQGSDDMDMKDMKMK